MEFGSTYIHQFVGLGNSAKYMANISNDTSSNYYLRHDASNNPGHVFELVDLDISDQITISPSFAQAVQYIEGISAQEYIWFGKHIYISGASTGISGQEYIEDQRNGIYWLQYMALQGSFMREKGSGPESIAAVVKFDKMQK